MNDNGAKDAAFENEQKRSLPARIWDRARRAFASPSLRRLENTPSRFWAMVILAGILGALLSAFTSAIGTDPKHSSIPAELSTLTITFARLMVAALSALAITLFLSSGILGFEQQNYAFLIAIAIISGFSDRLLLSAIERVTRPG